MCENTDTYTDTFGGRTTGGQHGLQTVPADLVLKHANSPASVSMWYMRKLEWAVTPKLSSPPYQHGAAAATVLAAML